MIDNIGNKIREINRSDGTSILSVEHDAPLSFGTAGYSYTLQVGELVAEGTVEEIRNNDVVKKHTSPGDGIIPFRLPEQRNASHPNLEGWRLAY